MESESTQARSLLYTRCPQTDHSSVSSIQEAPWKACKTEIFGPDLFFLMIEIKADLTRVGLPSKTLRLWNGTRDFHNDVLLLKNDAGTELF